MAARASAAIVAAAARATESASSSTSSFMGLSPDEISLTPHTSDAKTSHKPPQGYGKVRSILPVKFQAASPALESQRVSRPEGPTANRPGREAGQWQLAKTSAESAAP